MNTTAIILKLKPRKNKTPANGLRYVRTPLDNKPTTKLEVLIHTQRYSYA